MQKKTPAKLTEITRPLFFGAFVSIAALPFDSGVIERAVQPFISLYRLCDCRFDIAPFRHLTFDKDLPAEAWAIVKVRFPPSSATSASTNLAPHAQRSAK